MARIIDGTEISRTMRAEIATGVAELRGRGSELLARATGVRHDPRESFSQLQLPVETARRRLNAWMRGMICSRTLRMLSAMLPTFAGLVT